QVKPPAERPAEVAGRVIAIAEDGKNFTLLVPPARRGRGQEDEPKRSEVKIGEKTTVTYQGVGPNGARPTTGYAAQVQMEKGKDVAASVTFRGTADPFRRGPDLLARVAGVSKDGKTVTLEQPRRGRDEEGRKRDLRLSEKTQVVFHNVPPGGAKVAE